MENTQTPRRVEVYSTVRELILSGELGEGTRIVESALCQDLGISRTPLREALFRLEQEDLVKQDPARGFSVLPLSARDIREIYPMIWTLETLAVNSADEFNISLLKRLNKSLQTASSAERKHEIDDEWHEQLISGCRNRRLLKQISILKLSAHRYEMAYMRHSNKVGTSIEHHDRVLQALEKRDITGAARLLESHWQFGMNTLLEWLDWRET